LCGACTLMLIVSCRFSQYYPTVFPWPVFPRFLVHKYDSFLSGLIIDLSMNHQWPLVFCRPFRCPHWCEKPPTVEAFHRQPCASAPPPVAYTSPLFFSFSCYQSVLGTPGLIHFPQHHTCHISVPHFPQLPFCTFAILATRTTFLVSPLSFLLMFRETTPSTSQLIVKSRYASCFLVGISPLVSSL